MASRRGLLMGAGGAALGALSLRSGSGGPDHDGHDGPPPEPAPPHHSAMGGENGATFRAGASVDHARTGSTRREVLRDFDYGRVSDRPGRPDGPRVGGRGRGQGDRGRAGGAVPGVDLQRPHPRPDPALHAGRPAAGPVRQPVRAPAHDALPRHPPGGDGRCADGRARDHRAGRGVHLRVRRRAVRGAPLPLPRRAAGRAHRPRHVRHVHRRPAAAGGHRPTRW